MNKTFSLEELADAVREWCDQHRIVPANGQAADQVSERNIRYYRTLGLLDAPVGSYVKSFNEKHLLQLLAIRIYQAQGLPLRKIRDELYGKSEEELRQFTRTAAKTGVKLAPAFAPPPRQPKAGRWCRSARISCWSPGRVSTCPPAWCRN